MNNDVFTLHRGTRPLLVSVPHVGRLIPDDLRGHITSEVVLSVP